MAEKSNKNIKIAGLGLSWSSRYAILYKDTLIDMGYEARIIEDNNMTLVAYCPLPFDKQEAIDVLLKLKEEEKDSEIPIEFLSKNKKTN